ncbi:MAG: hypothetical protein CK548_02295 [Opitutia bacterium]|nr:MAG: hypothetical protein CK548_02295 [Opitutae bacterium]
MPVISVATQARKEGFFRLEWHLAEQRSLLIAKGEAFILLVTIDATSERGAIVPEAFLAVQWTRLPGGETNAAFAQRVRSLLGLDPAVAGASQPVGRDEGVASPTSRAASQVDRALPAVAWAVGAVLGLAVVLGFVWWRPATPVANAGAASRPLTAEKALAPAAPAEPRRGLKSVVVLPFENLSADKEANAVLVDGMHVDVISNLLLMREVRRVPLDTAMTYRGTKKTHKEIAEELGWRLC